MYRKGVCKKLHFAVQKVQMREKECEVVKKTESRGFAILTIRLEALYCVKIS